MVGYLAVDRLEDAKCFVRAVEVTRYEPRRASKLVESSSSRHPDAIDRGSVPPIARRKLFRIAFDPSIAHIYARQRTRGRRGTMKVISFHQSLPISDPESLLDLSTNQPAPGAHELLVEIRAIGINPVDAKIRAGGGPGSPGGDLKILGWDAAGIVREVGPDVTLFGPGDEVFYAGSVDRPGCYAEFQCVDERIESGSTIGKIVLAGWGRV